MSDTTTKEPDLAEKWQRFLDENRNFYGTFRETFALNRGAK